MNQQSPLHALAGTYRGTNRLWLPPATTPFESPSTATIAPAVGGKFVQLRYSWVWEETPQEGLLLIGSVSAGTEATVVFADSWHMDESIMLCHGQLEPDGTVDVRGSYGVEGEPQWGWRIVIELGEDTFRLAMFNIDPGGEEMLAVEVHYVRSAA